MTTEAERDERTPSMDERYYPTCWCWIGQPTPYWVVVFGGILTIIGGIWLLTNLGILPRLLENALGPGIVILIGLAYLVNGLALRK